MGETIPTITTPRLVLRAFLPSDAGALERVMGAPEVMQYFPVTTPPTMEQCENFIARQRQHWIEHGYGWWAVDSKIEARLIGWAGLQFLPDTQETEVAYLIAHEFWGQGLAVEAAAAGLRFGFGQLEMDTIIAVVHIDNARSCRVLDKLSMTRDRRDRYFGMDVYHYTLDRSRLSQGTV